MIAKTFKFRLFCNHFLNKVAFTFFISIFCFHSFSASLDEQTLTIDLEKPTVCTITINSDDEKQTFQSYLKEDFNFIELVTGEKDWFKKACKKKIQCDVLVVSGHFGGSFFGSSGHRLTLTELQSRSCSSFCDGILNRPKEVFLFGCNTTAGKKQDHRTPAEYTQVLIDDGFSRNEAEQISAFRYSPIGQTTEKKMQQVFSSARIYGFHSLAPSGKNIRQRLNKYFKSIKSYKNHLMEFSIDKENHFWSKAMKGQWIRSVNGSKKIEKPFCILEDKNKSVYEKLSWVNKVLLNHKKSLAYIPLINRYIKRLEKRFGTSWENFPGEELSLMEGIQFNEEAKERVNTILDKPINGILSAQVEVLNFTKAVGWYDKETYSNKLKNLLGNIFKNNLNVEQKNQICSLDINLDLGLEDLPQEKWNAHTITAIGCIKTQDYNVHKALAEALKDEDAEVRGRAAEALGKINPTDPQIHNAIVEALKDEKIYVRRMVAEALGEIKPTDPQVLEALVEVLKDENVYVRGRAAQALGRINPTDPQVLEALAEVLKDERASVRGEVAYALGKINPTDPQIHTALVEALKDESASVRGYAAQALGTIKSPNPQIHIALAEVLKDENVYVRGRAAQALGRGGGGGINPTDPQVLEALAEVLKDEVEFARRMAAEALENIKNKD